MSSDLQTAVVGLCVLLALVYTVWAGVRKARRVQQGGSACGGCSGDACGSSDCTTADGSAQPPGNGGEPAATPVQPIHWHPPVGRSGRPPPSP